MARKEKSWVLTDHICRNQKCQGRILCANFSVITGGGNPLFRCSGCGKQASNTDTSDLCWCGFHFRGQESGEYFCVRKDLEAFEKTPWLKDALANSGFDPDSPCEIGVVSRFALKISEERWDKKNDLPKYIKGHWGDS